MFSIKSLVNLKSYATGASILFLALSSTTVNMAHAETESASNQLELFVDQVLSATGQFRQSVIASDNTADANSSVQSGEFAFQRPGKFVWDVQQPYKQLVISDGNKIYQFDPDLDQVTQRSSGAGVANSPAALLFGSGSLADTFSVVDLPSQGPTQWLKATPKQKDAGFVSVEIGFANGLPAQLNLLDSFGQTTAIKFTNFEINPKLPSDKFTFVVPDGVDLVNMN